MLAHIPGTSPIAGEWRSRDALAAAVRSLGERAGDTICIAPHVVAPDACAINVQRVTARRPDGRALDTVLTEVWRLQGGICVELWDHFEDLGAGTRAGASAESASPAPSEAAGGVIERPRTGTVVHGGIHLASRTGQTSPPCTPDAWGWRSVASVRASPTRHAACPPVSRPTATPADRPCPDPYAERSVAVGRCERTATAQPVHAVRAPGVRRGRSPHQRCHRR